MAEKLDSIVQIDGTDYEVVAETAKKAEKVVNSLIINTTKNGITTKAGEFDGSKKTEITIEAGDAESAKNAETIQVNMDNNKKEYATITVSTKEPTNGNIGDIWFKY